MNIRLILMLLKNIHRLPNMYYKLRRHSNDVNGYDDNTRWNHIQYIMKCMVKASNIDLVVEGLEHIPKDNGFLMYGNHQGLFDPVALVSVINNPMSAVCKQELEKIPVIRRIIKSSNSVCIDRDDLKQSMGVLKSVEDGVKAGRNYVIFPEGTRSKTGEVGEFHGVVFKPALKTKCPIVPFVLDGCREVLDAPGLGKITVKIKFLEPILYIDYQGMKLRDLSDIVREQIIDRLHEMRGKN